MNHLLKRIQSSLATAAVIVAGCAMLTSCYKDAPLGSECDILRAKVSVAAPTEMFYNLSDTAVEVLSTDSTVTFTVRNSADLSALVSQVLARIQREGDAAVLDYERQFDHVELTSLAVTEAEFQAAEAQVGPELKSALELAQCNRCQHLNKISLGEFRQYHKFRIVLEISVITRCEEKI